VLFIQENAGGGDYFIGGGAGRACMNDLVVKWQAFDIITFILFEIWWKSIVQTSCQNRKS